MKIYSSSFIIGVLIISIVVGLFVAFPQYKNYKLEKEELFTKEKELSSLENYFSDLEETQKKLLEHKEELEKIEVGLPSQRDIPLFAYLINKASSDNGLLLKDAEAKLMEEKKGSRLSKEKSPLKKIELNITLLGTYESLKNFVSFLEKNARMIEIESIDFSPQGENKDNFEFRLKVSAYYLSH